MANDRTTPLCVTLSGGGGGTVVPRRFDQYGDVNDDKLLRAILAELKAIRSLLEKQNGAP